MRSVDGISGVHAEEEVNQVSFDPHGQSLAAVSLDGRVSLWNRGGQQLGLFSAQADGGDSYFQVAFRAAGRQRLGRRRA